MQQVNQTRRDPAPSRWSYRMQRWMLTPGLRTVLRRGLPLLALLGAGAIFWADQDRRDAFAMFVADIRATIQERPEFMVNLMAIDGAGGHLSEDIREVVPIDFPISSFDLELEGIREQILGLDPVKEASVRIRPGGILQIDVVERLPVVVWREYDGLSLVDETGHHVDKIASRRERADLPLILGRGAGEHVAEALALLGAAEQLGARLRGLAYRGERRWDVLLDRDQVIMLPVENPVRALERVLALDGAHELLARDIAVVDMRLGQRPTIRMSAQAVEALRDIKDES